MDQKIKKHIYQIYNRRDNMKERIINILEKEFNMKIDESFDKYSTEEWDSFKHLDIIVKLETEFNISFSPEEIGKMSSVLEIIEIINKKKTE